MTEVSISDFGSRFRCRLYICRWTYIREIWDVHWACLRKQSDWKAVEQITATLREFDPNDPVRFDFSLFGAGIDGFLKE